MALSFTIASKTFSVGQQIQSLSGLLPNTHNGYNITFTPAAAWPAGNLFTLQVDISSDAGVTWMPARTLTFVGDGTLNPHYLIGTWPGKHDNSANPGGRQVMWQTNARFTLNVLQAVTMAISGATV